jgi:poly-gamma-glutamate capsule biosynthesis protein CapA/YwtB (metallophosphatase superfamily)
MPVSSSIKIFLCGDVMTGRGIDQVLPHPSYQNLTNHTLKTPEIRQLAEQINGPIPKPVSFSYIWRDALEKFQRSYPDLRPMNLETSITKSDEYWKGKEIHYRMNPKNIGCLTEEDIDCNQKVRFINGCEQA